MAATKQNILQWIDDALAEECEYLIIVCDTSEYEDYPKGVKTRDDLRAALLSIEKEEMQRAIEVYDLSKAIAAQISEHRAGIDIISEHARQRKPPPEDKDHNPEGGKS